MTHTRARNNGTAPDRAEKPSTLPAGLWAWRVRPKVWFTPQFATAGAMALILPMYMIDCLSNAMANPTFMLVAGGLGPAAILAGKASKRGESKASRRAVKPGGLPRRLGYGQLLR